MWNVQYISLKVKLTVWDFQYFVYKNRSIMMDDWMFIYAWKQEPETFVSKRKCGFMYRPEMRGLVATNLNILFGFVKENHWKDEIYQEWLSNTSNSRRSWILRLGDHLLMHDCRCHRGRWELLLKKCLNPRFDQIWIEGIYNLCDLSKEHGERPSRERRQ